MMILGYNNFKWLDGSLSVTPGETTTCKSLIRYDDDNDVDENSNNNNDSSDNDDGMAMSYEDDRW